MGVCRLNLNYNS